MYKLYPEPQNVVFGNCLHPEQLTSIQLSIWGSRVMPKHYQGTSQLSLGSDSKAWTCVGFHCNLMYMGITKTLSSSWFSCFFLCILKSPVMNPQQRTSQSPKLGWLGFHVRCHSCVYLHATILSSTAKLLLGFWIALHTWCIMLTRAQTLKWQSRLALHLFLLFLLSASGWLVCTSMTRYWICLPT